MTEAPTPTRSGVATDLSPDQRRARYPDGEPGDAGPGTDRRALDRGDARL